MPDTDLNPAHRIENTGYDRELQQNTDQPRSAHAPHSWERGSISLRVEYSRCGRFLKKVHDQLDCCVLGPVCEVKWKMDTDNSVRKILIR